MRRCLAIDLGASSGRHIVGWKEDGILHTQEVHRFPNAVLTGDGHLTWDIEALYREVLTGIREAFRRYPDIVSLSVDSWGVDYVLLQGDTPLLPVYAYRDSRTLACVEQVHALVPFKELYQRTGCQFQSFNTLYQLWDDLQHGRLEKASDFLMIPEYLLYRLTGVKAKEYTNATTTGLVNAVSGTFDREITDALGLPRRLFPPLQRPWSVLGGLLPEVEAAVGGSCSVVLCATHDTASAVEGIPMEGNQPYISSGTWSLLGVRTPAPLTDRNSMAANYSNEGGVGYNRYQKNIMGLWLLSELQRELAPGLDHAAVERLARESRCDALVDANDPLFLAPESMKAAFDARTGGSCRSPGDYFRCACRSLAAAYARALDELEHNTGGKYRQLYIVGGGASNGFLNELTEEASGRKVLALPIEATALGNLKLQMEVI